jgi:hypothetical protein
MNPPDPHWLLLVLLAVQGVLGGLDTLVNHELIEHLPRRPQAKTEVGLHSIREAIYATLFGGLAWYEWHGMAAALVAALLAGEVLVTASDEFVENKTRVLPQNERVLHVLLTVNLGILIALLVPTLLDWASRPTQLVRVDHGWASWILSFLAVVGAGWSLRDLLAFRRL